MKKRFLFALLTAAIMIAMSAGNGGFAAPLPNAALSLSVSKTSAVTKVQVACGWTYACNGIGSGANVQIYGPVNVYTGVDAKPEVWQVPDGAWPWNGDQSPTWRGWGCGGFPCDEKCGAFCWFSRIRNGYCGHGCDAYRMHVAFQPHTVTVIETKRVLRPYIYQNPSDDDYGYGSQGGYGYGSGGASYGYGSGQGYSQTSSGQDGYGQEYSGQDGYNSSGDGSYGAGGGAPQGERFMDRLRRYFYGRPRGDTYPNTAAARNDNGPVRFERPSNDLTPLRRFNGPKYPPDSSQSSGDRPHNVK